MIISRPIVDIRVIIPPHKKYYIAGMERDTNKMTNAMIRGCEVSNGSDSIKCEYDVSKAWWDPGGKRFIVLMKFYENKTEKRFPNLVAFDVTDHLIWEAELPNESGADCFTDAEVVSNELIAFSFTCYRCVIDMSDGRLLSTVFTK